MEEADQDFGFGPAHAAHPALVSLAPFPPIPSPSPRRLSSCFTKPGSPVPSARKLAWVSLQGRLVNAEEASSARAIGGGLSRKEAAAWELFTPIQRFLIVAVIGVAVAESKKNRLIWQLKKSVELRDQVLSSMQQKLDNLCEQVNNVKDQPGTGAYMSFNKNVESPHNETFGCDKIKFVDCGCWHCDQHHNLFAGLVGNSVMKASSGDDILQFKMTFTNEAEQEERRMSDLSDLASSVTSAAELQMNSFAIEHDIFNLKKECKDKDATIKELTTVLQSSNMAGSKRIAELEDVIRRKNMIITRLKKDLVVIEQKVVHLTRLRRPSSSASSSASSSNSWQAPVMADNLLYDMDNTTSSSSDSDCSPVNRPQAPVAQAHVAQAPVAQAPVAQAPVAEVQENPVEKGEVASPSTANQKSVPANALNSSVRPTDWHTRSRSASPLKEISTSKSNMLSSLRHKRLSASGESKKIRRRTQTDSKSAAPQKRWV